MPSTRGSPQSKGYTQTKSKGIKKGIVYKWEEKAGVAILICNKIDREGHYIMIKVAIQ